MAEIHLWLYPLNYRLLKLQYDMVVAGLTMHRYCWVRVIAGATKQTNNNKIISCVRNEIEKINKYITWELCWSICGMCSISLKFGALLICGVEIFKFLGRRHNDTAQAARKNVAENAQSIKTSKTVPWNTVNYLNRKNK